VLCWQKDRVVFVLKEGISPTSLLTKKAFPGVCFEAVVEEGTTMLLTLDH